MAVAMVLCVAATTAAAPVEIDAGGLIHRGPHLMCGDQEAMIHLLYEGRPLIHDTGVFCGINGYTQPRDLQNKTLTRQADRFIITGKRGTPRSSLFSAPSGGVRPLLLPSASSEA